MKRGVTLIEVLIIISIIGILAVVVFGRGCSDVGGATKALQGHGFTDIKLESPKHFFTDCGEGDRVNHPFTATNATGKSVSGTVCCGGPLSFKGCTVRF